MKVSPLGPQRDKERRESAQSLVIGSILRSREDSLHDYVFVVGALWALTGFYITFALGPMIVLGYFAASATIFVRGCPIDCLNSIVASGELKIVLLLDAPRATGNGNFSLEFLTIPTLSVVTLL